MTWKINYLKSVQKEIKKITKKDQNKIRMYLEEHIAELDDPRSQGKALKGTLSEFWRYRVASYRIICQIDDKAVTVLVVRVAHRKDVYKNKEELIEYIDTIIQG